MRRLIVSAVAAAIGLSLIPFASADSVWSDPGYHWNATAPLTVSVVSHLTSANLQSDLATSAADWSHASSVDVALSSSGKVDVYEGDYGTGTYIAWTRFDLNNGTLRHAYVYLNDSYKATMNDFSWGVAVCQELGHALGLGDHRLDVPTTSSCMAPNNYGTSPNADDLQELDTIYSSASSQSSTTVKGNGKGGGGPHQK